MKKYLLLILLMLSLSTFAQQSVYYPFPESNAQWNMQLSLMGYPGPASYEFYSIIISGDTSINAALYHKLTVPYVAQSVKSSNSIITAGYKGAIRQDVGTRKVFIVPPGTQTEELLYDFTLQAGDTVRGYLENNLTTKDVVNSIDSVLVGDTYRKRWKINEGYGIYLIEGVGSTYGLVEFSPGAVVDWADISITCFKQDGITLYPADATGCSLITSVSPRFAEKSRFTIFPNPSKGSFTVDFDKPGDAREIRLTDMHGKVIMQESVDGRSNILVSNLATGLYHVSVIDKNNSVSSRRVANY